MELNTPTISALFKCHDDDGLEIIIALDHFVDMARFKNSAKVFVHLTGDRNIILSLETANRMIGKLEIYYWSLK